MDLQNIQDQLNTEFAKDSTNYIFWFDDKAEYEDEVSELQLGDVKLHILDGKNWLYSKYLLNEEDTESKYLIYAPFQDRVMQKIHLQICTIIRFLITPTGYRRHRRRWE